MVRVRGRADGNSVPFLCIFRSAIFFFLKRQYDVFQRLMRIQKKGEVCLSYVAFGGGVSTCRKHCIEGNVLYALHRGAANVLKLYNVENSECIVFIL